MCRDKYSMETPDQVGDLHLISKSRTGAVYTTFNAFEFDHVWSQFQKLGATSCNVIPDGDTDSVTFEVYYPDVQNSQRKHTRCQWALLGICSLIISAIAIWPDQDWETMG